MKGINEQEYACFERPPMVFREIFDADDNEMVQLLYDFPPEQILDGYILSTIPKWWREKFRSEVVIYHLKEARKRNARLVYNIEKQEYGFITRKF